MNPTYNQLVEALRSADAAGDQQAAMRFAELLKTKQYSENTEPEQTETPQEDEQSFKDKLVGTINAGGQGLTFGFADEAQAAMLSLVGTNLPESMGGLPDSISLAEAYRGIRDELRGNNKEFAEENPKTALAAEILGGAATGGTGLLKTATTQTVKQGMKQATVTGAKIGGVTGGTYAAGTSEADLTQGEVNEFAADTSAGVATGALMGGLVSGGIGAIQSKLAKNKEIAEILKSNPKDTRAAKYILEGEKAIKFPAAKNAIKQGFDEGAVALVKGSSLEDKKAYRKMLLIVKRGANDRLSKEANQVTDVVGDSVAKRYQYVKNVNRMAGKRLDNVANNLKGKTLDSASLINDFKAELANKFRINVNDVDGKLTPEFSLSSVENVAESQKVIKNIFDRLNKVDSSQAFELHHLKKMIDQDVFNGKSQGGVSGQVDAVVGRFRASVDDLLDSNFPAYNKVNSTYSDTINALNQFDSAVGRSVSELTSNNDKAIGRVMRRLTSNSATREKLGNSFDLLEDVAKKYGSKFNDNIRAQSSVANELVRMFKLSGDNTLKGQVGQSITDNAVNSLNRSTVGNVAEGTKAAINKARNINNEAAIKAFRALLTR